MAAEPSIFHLNPDSEIVLVLKRAASEHGRVHVHTGEEVIEIGDVSTRPIERVEDGSDPQESNNTANDSDEDRKEGDPLLSILGIFASGEPNNDVAQDKYRYLAEAYLSERR